MGFLLIGFFVGAKGWANTLEAMKSDIPIPQLELVDEIRLEQARGVNRAPGILEEPHYVDTRFNTREEAAAQIAAPVLDPLPPEGAEDTLRSNEM